MSEADKFKGDLDRYKGLTVKSDQEPCPLEALDKRLEASLASWRQQGVRAVWFLVSHDQADWVPVLVKHGFKFHNADPSRLAMMQWIGEETGMVGLSNCRYTYSLDPDDTCNVPSYAHTLVGVGGMVVDEDNNVLVVQERFRFSNHWKLPGGYVDPGEDIHTAAIREVFEETGVKTKFRWARS